MATSDDKSWITELENALLEECSATDIYCICKGRSLPEELRAQVWQICLDVQDEPDQLIHFNEIFDLPNQSILREDCQNVALKLGNDLDEKVSVISDLESILTFYCKSRNLQYKRSNGWIELLLPLIALKIPKNKIYNLFEAIRDTYVPNSCHLNGNSFHVLRLLLLYHDPQLCSFLDTKKIPPDSYSLHWFQTLFAGACNLNVVLNIWDLYFQNSDPFFVFFLSLIMIINARDQIISMKNEPREKIIDMIASMPCELEADDVIDFCSLATYYTLKTPVSFRTNLMQNLYKTLVDEDVSNEGGLVSQALCLPVSASELIENSQMLLTPPSSSSAAASVAIPSADTVRFFLVDCRPADQYNAGHLPTAFHLDCNLMLQEPSAFQTAVQGLLNAQKQALSANSVAGGEHLCFLGSGRNEEDQYVHMVIASFLQKHTQYVSMVTGGYTNIHNYFTTTTSMNGIQLSDCLTDHNYKKCLVCSPNTYNNSSSNNNNNYNYSNNHNNSTLNINNSGGGGGGGDGDGTYNNNNISSNLNNSDSNSVVAGLTPIENLKTTQSVDLFGKISASLKSKTFSVKDKLFDYIVNPTNNSSTSSLQQNQNNPSGLHQMNLNNQQQENIRHVSSADKNGKRYRDVAPVFSIDDESDNIMAEKSLDDDETRELVPLSTWLKSPDTIETFKCQEVRENGHMYNSHLIVTESHLIVLRELPENKKGMTQVIVRRPLSSIVKITAKKRHPELITFKYGVPDGETLLISDMDRFLIPNASKATKIVSDQILKQLKNKDENLVE